jgi:hypothetical protein
MQEMRFLSSLQIQTEVDVPGKDYRRRRNEEAPRESGAVVVENIILSKEAVTQAISDFVVVLQQGDAVLGRKEIIVPAVKPSRALPAMVDRLRELSALRRNWNGRGSPPPNDQAIRQASSVADRLAGAGVEPPRVSASAMGGVTFHFLPRDGRPPGVFASIDCLNSGERLAMLSDRNSGQPEVWEIEKDEMPETIRRIQRFLLHATSPR